MNNKIIVVDFSCICIEITKHPITNQDLINTNMGVFVDVRALMSILLVFSDGFGFEEKCLVDSFIASDTSTKLHRRLL